MSLLKAILEAQNGGAIKQIAQQFNLPAGDVSAGVAQWLPALTGAMKRNAAQPGGLESLLGALKGGGHSRYLEQPEQITQQAAINDGNGILGHLLGSKDVSRQVATQASQKTGIDVGVLKKMLPMVAAMTMGSMGREVQSAGIEAPAPGAQSQFAPQDVLGKLSGILDADNDGSVVDNLLGLAKKFF